jgi:hypothetical protein
MKAGWIWSMGFGYGSMLDLVNLNPSGRKDATYNNGACNSDSDMAACEF